MGVVEYATSSNSFSTKLNTRKYGIDPKTISPRVLNHWIANGLISDHRDSNKAHHRFSLSDLMWIQILLRLRSFGCSLPSLRQVKEVVEFGKRPWCERPLIEFHIALTLKDDTTSFLIVFPNGEALIGTEDEVNLSAQEGTIQDDFIRIDLGKLSRTQPTITDSFTAEGIEAVRRAVGYCSTMR